MARLKREIEGLKSKKLDLEYKTEQKGQQYNREIEIK